ncbi:MAG: methyltransferase domain-containing protein [Actinomycetota bacterium]|nr:methyltransferase domain-containing protein [Actinomycetota bacterium]
MSDRVYETYDSLWGVLMFVMHDPDHLSSVNEGRADWFESLGLGGQRVLDLGSGNGYFDLALGNRGYQVVAVDQVAPVFEAAQALASDEPVEFIASDLRHLDFGAGSFDAVTMFGVSGLMSIEHDIRLMENCYRWLAPGGHLLVDSDIELADTQTITAQHDLGAIRWNWTSDADTRTNMLTPELHRNDGVVVGLRDPIDLTRGDHEGLHRYIYPKDDLTGLLTSIGFTVETTPHYTEYVFPNETPGSYMLKASRP